MPIGAHEIKKARERLGELPMWAQRYISLLEDKADFLDMLHAQPQSDSATSSFRIRLNDRSEHYVPSDTVNVHPNPHLDANVSVYVRDREIHLLGSGKLLVSPRSANHIMLYVAD